MKRIQHILAAGLAAFMLAAVAPQQAEAAAITAPILLTEGNVEQTVNGVTYSVRKDYNHPYAEYTSAYGDQYDRQLVVEMTITNQSGAAIGYMAYMSAADVNGKALVNADPLAPYRIGILENGASVTVLQMYQLTKENDITSFTLCYPPTAVYLTVNYPMQQPGVGGADRRSAIKGSVLK